MVSPPRSADDGSCLLVSTPNKALSQSFENLLEDNLGVIHVRVRLVQGLMGMFGLGNWGVVVHQASSGGLGRPFSAEAAAEQKLNSALSSYCRSLGKIHTWPRLAASPKLPTTFMMLCEVRKSSNSGPQRRWQNCWVRSSLAWRSTSRRSQASRSSPG